MRVAAAVAAEVRRAIGWRPIAEAPKDGTDIILYAAATESTPKRVTVGRWVEESVSAEREVRDFDGNWLGTQVVGNNSPAYWMSWDGGFTQEHQPTRWMPLPDPPKEPKS
jgi:hypothetical protein